MDDLATKIADITLRKSFNTIPNGKTGNPFDYARQQAARVPALSSDPQPAPSPPPANRQPKR